MITVTLVMIKSVMIQQYFVWIPTGILTKEDQVLTHNRINHKAIKSSNLSLGLQVKVHHNSLKLKSKPKPRGLICSTSNRGS